MYFEAFNCGHCAETHYHLTIPTEECVEISRQEIVVEFDRESLERLMENIQRQLLHTPVKE